MPVTRLLVEGELDAQVLHAVLGGRPVVEAALCSKTALLPRTRAERERTKARVSYLRDRDFDFEPPGDLGRPATDRAEGGDILGWRWCRHELESYLLDPTVVTPATGWDEAEYAHVLADAGRRLLHYQAARWVIGLARGTLPPPYELNTRPDDIAHWDLRIPANLGEEATLRWLQQHVTSFSTRLHEALDQEAITRSFVMWSERLALILDSAAAVLLWCSAKDILAVLDAWLQTRGMPNPGAFRARMRDWVRENGPLMLAAFPEWNSLVRVLRT